MQEMQRNSFHRWTSATALIGMLGLAGCASGYSAPSPPAVISQPPSNNFTSGGQRIIPYAYDPDLDTGSVGPVGAPAAGSWGTAAPQIATPGGSTISGSAGPYSPRDTTFPVLATGLQFTPGGAGSPVAIAKDAAATVTQSTYSDPCLPNVGFTVLQLAIPSANVNTTIYVGLGGNTADANGNPDPLNYIALGNWHGGPISFSGPFLFYVFGYETPISAVPASGQASFSGKVSGQVFAPIDGHVVQAGLGGNANVTADFASGNVMGALTGLQYHGGGSANGVVQGPWNDVSLTAAIASGSNRFSGSTAVTSSPSSPFSLSGSAAGHIDGAFFGPTAQAVGAVWTLSDGAAAAIGTIAAKR